MPPWSAGGRRCAHGLDNADTLYVINAVEKRPSEVLIVRFTPPTFPRGDGEHGATEVRYASIDQANRLTSTPFATKDEELRLSGDGFVSLVRAEERGYNFMPWKVPTPEATSSTARKLGTTSATMRPGGAR